MLIALAAPAWASNIVVICKGVNTPDNSTIYVNTDARAVRVVSSSGLQYERPASIDETSIEWSTDNLNHYRLDRYSGLLVDPSPNGRGALSWACSTASEPKIK